MQYVKIVKAIIITLVVMMSMPVMSAGLQVTPIVLDINQSQPSDGIWLTNTSGTALHAQIRVFAWSQQTQQDVLEATPHFVASPPLIKVEAGQRQFVRLVRVGSLENQQEQAYRIVVDELPLESEGESGLTFVLRYSIPVFIQGKENKQEPSLNFHVTRNDQNEAVLVATNRGNTRAQLSRLSFTQTNGKTTVLNEGLVGYALANSTNQLVIASNTGLFTSGGVFNVFVNGTEQQFSVGALQ